MVEGWISITWHKTCILPCLDVCDGYPSLIEDPFKDHAGYDGYPSLLWFTMMDIHPKSLVMDIHAPSRLLSLVKSMTCFQTPFPTLTKVSFLILDVEPLIILI